MKKFLKIILILSILLISLLACVFDTDDDPKINELAGTWVDSLKYNTSIINLAIMYSEKKTITFSENKSYNYEQIVYKDAIGNVEYSAKHTGTYTVSIDTASNIKKVNLNYTYEEKNNGTIIGTGTKTNCQYYKVDNSNKLYIVDSSTYISSGWPTRAYDKQ